MPTAKPESLSKFPYGLMYPISKFLKLLLTSAPSLCLRMASKVLSIWTPRCSLFGPPRCSLFGPPRCSLFGPPRGSLFGPRCSLFGPSRCSLFGPRCSHFEPPRCCTPRPSIGRGRGGEGGGVPNVYIWHDPHGFSLALLHVRVKALHAPFTGLHYILIACPLTLYTDCMPPSRGYIIY